MAKAVKKKAKKRTRKPKVVERTLSIADAVSEAYGELTTLGEELRSWHDNMPENFQSGNKGEAVNEAADALEAIEEPEVLQSLGVLEFTFSVVAGRGNSRAKRRDDAVAVMEAMITFLGEIDADMEEKKQKDRSARIQALNLPELGTDKAAEIQKEAAGLHSQMEEDKDAAEAVEFPGQFG